MDDTHCPVIYLMIGAPGSGKSTYIREYLQPALERQGRSAVVISADALRSKLVQNPRVNPSQIYYDKKHSQIVNDQFDRELHAALEDGRDIIIDRHYELPARKKILSQLPPQYKKVAIVIQPGHLDDCIQNSLSRDVELIKEGKPPHFLPFRFIKNRWDGLTVPGKDEGFDEIKNVAYTSQSMLGVHR